MNFVPIQCVSFSVYVCLWFGVIGCQSLLWPNLTAFNNDGIHFGEAPRPPRGRVTVNTRVNWPALLGLHNSQSACPLFFPPPCAKWGEDSGWTVKERVCHACMFVSWLSSAADLKEVVKVVLGSWGDHGSHFPGAHLLHQHLDFVQLQDAFGPRQVLEMLSKCNQTCANVKNIQSRTS